MNKIRITLVCIALCGAAFGGILFSADRADAYTTSYQANMLGGTNGTYGNVGSNYSVDALWSEIVGNWIFGGHSLPMSVALQEVCKTANTTNDQWDTLSSRLRQYGYYARQFYVAKYSSPQCPDKGNGVLGRMNDNSSEWYPSFQGQFPTQAGGNDEPRGSACVYPTLWIVSYATCSAHLATNDSAARNQGWEYWFQMATQVISGKPSIFPGDFNLPPNCCGPNASHPSPDHTGPQQFYQTGWPIETDGWSLRSTFHSENPTVKIDYSWIWGFSVAQSPYLLAMAYGPSGSTLLGHRASDHLAIVSYT